MIFRNGLIGIMNTTFSEAQKKRFYIISFVVMPVLFITGYYVGTEIAVAFGFSVNSRGITFVAFILIVLYLKSIHTVYKILIGKKTATKK